MTIARRLAAATMALVLALFPVALERCRTACVSANQATQASTASHACHGMAGDESAMRLDPLARACGHGDEARTTYESVSLLAGKTSTVAPLGAIQPSPWDVQLVPVGPAGWPAVRSVLPRLDLPLDLPLRL